MILDLPGIYMIESNDTRIYIGSSVSCYDRIAGHKSKLLKNKHHNQKLQNVYNKHGLDYFKFSVLEYIDDKSRIIYYEQIWLDILFQSLDKKYIYNFAKIANTSLGVKHSKEYRQRISTIRKASGCRPPVFTGHSEKSKLQIRESHRLRAVGMREEQYAIAKVLAAVIIGDLMRKIIYTATGN